MSDIAIRVRNLGKLYKIGELKKPYKTFSETLMEKFKKNKPDGKTSEFWALKDVSFDIKKGEVVGIIGKNGAGKSTLLKTLSRITEPTVGEVDLHGRVGSLLEVGTGFHPELTGRENVYLNGAILGMKKAEITKKFDEIVAFSELEKFIDTPVKHYSSGMYMRLAFAVAAYLETEILLVDEVLAVGDASFQKKCVSKIGDVSKHGRTVFFVSHNLQAIASLSERLLILEAGRIFFDGEVHHGIQKYREMLGVNQMGKVIFTDPNKTAGLIYADVKTSCGENQHQFGRPLTFNFEIVFDTKPKAAFFSFQIMDDDNRAITHLWVNNIQEKFVPGRKILLQCSIVSPVLYMGKYTITTHLSDRGSFTHQETLEQICPFEITMDGTPREYPWQPGACFYLEHGNWEVRGS